jgi:hypothetical protein
MPRKLTLGYLYNFRNPKPWHRPWMENVRCDGAWAPLDFGADDDYMPSIPSRKAASCKTMSPEHAIEQHHSVQARMPIEQFTMLLPSGLRHERLRLYAGLFPAEVLPAVR